MVSFLSLVEKIAAQEPTQVHPKLTEDLLKFFGPQYQSGRCIEHEGESIGLFAYDKGNFRNVFFKIALPQAQRRVKLGFGIVINYGETNKFQKEETHNEFKERFLIGGRIQADVHNYATGKAGKIGYVPAIYRVAESVQEPTMKSIQPGLYIEMEFIEGKSLLSWAKNREAIELLEMFWSILSFFEVALHSKSIVHADVKASNILVDQSGRPVILDFKINQFCIHNGI